MANLKLTEIKVSLAERSYAIQLARNSLDDKKLLRSLITSSQVFIVTDDKVSNLYLEQLKSAFKDLQSNFLILPHGEENKNEMSLFSIYNALIENFHHRDTTLIALGGGVIGDICGFAAATYQRGTRFIQIPTTLLAQVDASVGGKTAINYKNSKNIIGAFYQPQSVLIDIDTLKTLPAREFSAGVAEIIKYAMLVGGSFYVSLRDALRDGFQHDSPALESIIAECCRIKALYVENDEKEEDKRALLNLGHTFAHALESYTNYKLWLHGEAVAIGLYCAVLLSFNLGLADIKYVTQTRELLNLANLNVSIPTHFNIKELVSLMALDKKIKNGKLVFVLIQNYGHCFLSNEVPEQLVIKTLQQVQTNCLL